jgi:hypothetical protein
MTGIIPCLYNSFSFTLENIVGGDIVCYESRVDRKRNIPEISPAPAPAGEYAYIPLSVVEITDSDSSDRR